QSAGITGFRVGVGIVFLGAAVVCALCGSRQAEQFGNVLHHVFKAGFVLFVSRHIIAVKFGVGDFLLVHIGQEGVVVGTGIADGQAAGLVVAGYNNQRFVW